MSENGSAPHILYLRAMREDRAGDALAGVFDAYWPAYRAWMKRAGSVERSRFEGALRRHMPELVSTYEALLGAVGDSDDKARFLSLYRPPAVVRACSQAVVETPDGPALVRNYDHAPSKFDGVVLRSAWAGRAAVAPTDCLWGALDGVNEDGLAVALAFGGRDVEGDGFAAPLIVRYLLETCATTAEAIAALERLPCYMSYIFVVVDAAGEYVTAHLSPDRPAALRRRRASTNHRLKDEWPEYVRFSRSAERLDAVQAELRGRRSLDDAVGTFLRPPVWRTDYERGAGTLYTAVYRPVERSLELRWPGRVERFSIGAFEPRAVEAVLAGDEAFGEAGIRLASQ